jgi:hypothetical protein
VGIGFDQFCTGSFLAVGSGIFLVFLESPLDVSSFAHTLSCIKKTNSFSKFVVFCLGCSLDKDTIHKKKKKKTSDRGKKKPNLKGIWRILAYFHIRSGRLKKTHLATLD